MDVLPPNHSHSLLFSLLNYLFFFFLVHAKSQGSIYCLKTRGGGATPYNCLCGEAPPEMANFYTLHVHERIAGDFTT